MDSGFSSSLSTVLIGIKSHCRYIQEVLFHFNRYWSVLQAEACIVCLTDLECHYLSSESCIVIQSGQYLWTPKEEEILMCVIIFLQTLYVPSGTQKSKSQESLKNSQSPVSSAPSKDVPTMVIYTAVDPRYPNFNVDVCSVISIMLDNKHSSE